MGGGQGDPDPLISNIDKKAATMNMRVYWTLLICVWKAPTTRPYKQPSDNAVDLVAVTHNEVVNYIRTKKKLCTSPHGTTIRLVH